MSLQGQSICTNISIIDDNNVENSTEYFYVNLKSVDTVHTVIQIPQASVTITEDTDDGKYYTYDTTGVFVNCSTLFLN